MAEEANNLVLEHLRRIRAVVDETRYDVKRFVCPRVSLSKNFSTAQVSEAAQNLEIDRIKDRLDRIERRPELSHD